MPEADPDEWVVRGCVFSNTVIDRTPISPLGIKLARRERGRTRANVVKYCFDKC